MLARIGFALAAVVFAVAPTFADEPKKDEPTAFYTSWSKFKPGTSVTMSGTLASGQGTDDVSVTITLTETKAKDGVLGFEMRGSKTSGGKTELYPVQQLEVKKSEGYMGLPVTLDKKTGKPVDAVDEGTEKVKVGGTEYDCTWYKTRAKVPGGEVTEGKVWVCEKFPGCLIKIAGQFREVKADLSVTAVTIKK